MLHTFQHNGLSLQYYDNQQEGPVIVFQHGLTGNHQQTRGTFTDGSYRLITLNCRGHGDSDLGPIAELSISTFADDVIALLDHLQLRSASVAGISMGAAICAVLIARYPGRINSATLVRPAFHRKRAPEIQQVHCLVANYIEFYGPEVGLKHFKETESYETLARKSADNVNSLVAMFAMDPARVVPLLKMIAMGDPCFDAKAIRQAGIPLRVIGTFYDEIHPIRKAEIIRLDLGIASVDIAYPKILNRDRYNQDITAVIKSNVV